MYQSLTRETLLPAVTSLCAQDSLMNSLVEEFGPPPLWQRTQSLETLIHVVLEQKVSLASAKAVMLRVKKLAPSLSPMEFLAVPESALRDAGVSERKVSYCRSIAEAMVSGELDLKALRRCSNDEVMQSLIRIRGIGPWTAGVYLLMAMRRSDAWASGDRALVVSYAQCTGAKDIPSYPELDDIAKRWAPYRGVAARVLWHAYLSRAAQ